MRYDSIIWDLDDDPNGNVQHCDEHGIAKEEVEQAKAMKRITRNRHLTPEKAAEYKTLREQVAEDLPELIARHHQRTASLDELGELLAQLKAAREAQGLSLADLTELTGMDRSAISKLETGERPNPTVLTLVRYAEAVGKRLVVSLVDTNSR